MARILLLDDSLTIHKVVRLTFASSPEMELKVGKSPAETLDLLASFRPDVVIAYIRFSGEANPEYFKSIAEKCPAILLLTESNENLEPFRAAGFTQFLKKPFHSDELRQTVKALIPAPSPVQDSLPNQFDGDPENSEFNNPQEDEATLAVRVPHATAARFAPPSPAAAARVAAPPLPAAPSPQAVAKPLPPLPSQEAFRTTAKAKTLTENQAEKNAEAHSSGLEIPEITMDIEALEKSYRATLSQRDKPSTNSSTNSSQVVGLTAGTFAPEASAEVHSNSHELIAKPYEPHSDFPTSAPLRPPLFVAPPPASPHPAGPFSAAPRSAAPRAEFHFSSEETAESSLKFDEPFVFQKPSMVPEIEVDSSFASKPLVLENVVMHSAAKKIQHESHSFLAEKESVPKISAPKISIDAMRHEIEAAIDDALLRALERSVPAKIEQKLEAEWSRFVGDVGDRVRTELQATVKDWFAREISSVKNVAVEQIRDSIRPEFKNQVQNWISRESVNLAKEVVREEIRKLLEEES